MAIDMMVHRLIEACFEDRIEDVKRLIAEGADVNGRDLTGSTVLEVRRQFGGFSPEIVKLLLDSGAELIIEDGE